MVDMSELEEFFPEKGERQKAEQILEEFYDDLLLDESVTDADAAVLCIYMIANQEESNQVAKQDVRQLFERFGREGDGFSKAVYELANRRDPPVIKEHEDGIGLTFQGKKRVESVLEEDSGE